MKNLLTQQVRGWIYRVLVAVGVALTGFGIITADKVALIMGVVVAVLNILPSANTSIKSQDGE